MLFTITYESINVFTSGHFPLSTEQTTSCPVCSLMHWQDFYTTLLSQPLKWGCSITSRILATSCSSAPVNMSSMAPMCCSVGCWNTVQVPLGKTMNKFCECELILINSWRVLYTHTHTHSFTWLLHTYHIPWLVRLLC